MNYLFHQIYFLISENFIVEIGSWPCCLLMWSVLRSDLFLFAESWLTVLAIMNVFRQNHIVEIALKQTLYMSISSNEQYKDSFFYDHFLYEKDILSCLKAKAQHKEKWLYHPLIPFWLLFLQLHPLPGLSLYFEFD